MPLSPRFIVTIAGLALTATSLAGYLAVFRGDHRRLMLLTKMTASTGFLITALAGGALESTYGKIVLAALVFCWFGDYFLLTVYEGAFLPGLVSFFLAHLGFCAAFWLRDTSAGMSLASALVLIPVAVVVLRWLYPSIPKNLRVPVLAYMAEISIMVALAAGTLATRGGALILAGAVIFYASDLFVARERFVKPDFANTILGLPLYYGGVTLLALSVLATGTPG
jgi:uncharacterized membrane protein YhhN